MRLSDKYCIDKIKGAIVERITKDWPTTVNQYDSAAQARMEMGSVFPMFMTWDYAFPEPVAAIELATKFDIPEILPAAFYRLATINTSINWSDMEYKPAGRWSELSPQNMVRFIIGRDKLYKSTVQRILEVLEEPSEHTACDTVRAVQRQDFITATLLEANVTGYMDPLRIYHQLREKINGTSGICFHCQFRIADRLNEERGVVWECLEEFFDLPNPQPTQ